METLNLSLPQSQTRGIRSSPRIRDGSRLVIDGRDLLGHSFSENSVVHDISRTGVSFYLKNRPWIDDDLEITIYPCESREASHFTGRKMRGRVVRTGDTSEDRQFIAARFL